MNRWLIIYFYRFVDYLITYSKRQTDRAETDRQKQREKEMKEILL